MSKIPFMHKRIPCVYALSTFLKNCSPRMAFSTSHVSTHVMPQVIADTFAVGIAKRLFLLVAVGSFTSTLTSVLVATIALDKYQGGASSTATTLAEFFADEAHEFDYLACKSHFYIGVLGEAPHEIPSRWSTTLIHLDSPRLPPLCLRRFSYMRCILGCSAAVRQAWCSS